jgi:hypothetical protein
VSGILGDPPRYEQRAWPLLEPATERSLVVVGACDGLYRGQDDGAWVPIEVAASGGRLHLVADLAAVAASGTTEPVAVATVGSGADRLTLTATASGPDEVVLALARSGEPVGPTGGPVPVTDAVQQIEWRADPTFAWTQAFVDGDEALFVTGRPPAERNLTLGADPDGDLGPFPGSVEARTRPTPTCDAIVGR